MLGSRVEGNVIIIAARLSVNLRALTIEQVISKRRQVCMDMCDTMALELRRETQLESWGGLRRFLRNKLDLPTHAATVLSGLLGLGSGGLSRLAGAAVGLAAATISLGTVLLLVHGLAEGEPTDPKSPSAIATAGVRSLATGADRRILATHLGPVLIRTAGAALVVAVDVSRDLGAELPDAFDGMRTDS